MTFSPFLSSERARRTKPRDIAADGCYAGSRRALSYPFGSSSPALQHALQVADVCTDEMEGVRRARQDRYIGRKLSPAAEGTGGETHMDGYKLATDQAYDGARAWLVVDDKGYDALDSTRQTGEE